jgi:phosphoenolpyruvate---glycerone phosphotransferase subunit DhaK
VLPKKVPLMKKLINSPENVVHESMRGLEAAFPDLVSARFNPDFIIRKDAPVQGKVAIVSGGGSGHEPMHGGFVGRGMLDAACPGAVFTSPTPDQMHEATKAVNGGKGVLHIVKNYTGDVLNFEMAADLARSEGVEVEAVVIDDDVAVKDSLYTAGRRGVGTTVLTEKICGAAAEASRSLKEVADLCKKVNSQGRSMGMALTSCTVPHVGKPTFEIGDDEMEIGIGIHGEPGRQRMKIKPADEVTEMLVKPIIEDLPFKSGDEVLLFVNSMGGTPLLELFVVYRKAHELLKNAGVKVTRSLVGPYITSLEMAGASVTVLKLDNQLTQLWDAPVVTPGLRWGA